MSPTIDALSEHYKSKMESDIKCAKKAEIISATSGTTDVRSSVCASTDDAAQSTVSAVSFSSITATQDSEDSNLTDKNTDVVSWFYYLLSRIIKDFLRKYNL